MLECPTARQLEVLREIFTFWEKRSYAPAIRELCDKLGVVSTNAMSDHLKALKRRGLIDWMPRKQRTIRLTQLGRDHLLGRAA